MGKSGIESKVKTNAIRHFSKGIDFFSLRTPPFPLKAGTSAHKKQSLLFMKPYLSSGLVKTNALLYQISRPFSQSDRRSIHEDSVSSDSAMP